MKKTTIKHYTLKELAESWKIDYEVIKIKTQIIKKIKTCCDKHSISQRSLAKLVPGLTQDRVSKIFNDQVGHMTIDKLIQILSILNIKITVSLKDVA